MSSSSHTSPSDEPWKCTAFRFSSFISCVFGFHRHKMSGGEGCSLTTAVDWYKDGNHSGCLNTETQLPGDFFSFPSLIPLTHECFIGWCIRKIRAFKENCMQEEFSSDHVHMHACVSVHVCPCMCVCVQVCECVGTCMCACECTCMYFKPIFKDFSSLQPNERNKVCTWEIVLSWEI